MFLQENRCISGKQEWLDILTELLLLSWIDVVPDDFDVLISVPPRLFVPEADGVSDLVNDCALLPAAFANADKLLTRNVFMLVVVHQTCVCASNL